MCQKRRASYWCPPYHQGQTCHCHPSWWAGRQYHHQVSLPRLWLHIHHNAYNGSSLIMAHHSLEHQVCFPYRFGNYHLPDSVGRLYRQTIRDWEPYRNSEPLHASLLIRHLQPSDTWHPAVQVSFQYSHLQESVHPVLNTHPYSPLSVESSRFHIRHVVYCPHLYAFHQQIVPG